MGSNDKNFSSTGYEPNHYFLTETYVEFNQESVTEQRFPEQRFPEDVAYDDAAIGQMLFNAYRGQVDHSEREGLSSGLSSSSMSDRTGPTVVNSDKSHDRMRQPVAKGHETQRQNSEKEQIRTFLDRQREQTLADCQAEIRKHEFQADYDRRSTRGVRKLSLNCLFAGCNNNKFDLCRPPGN